MRKITNRVWVGNSHDEEYAAGMGSILNVALDLPPKRCWPAVEYMHVGLVDGPGNPPTAYIAAIHALCTLLARGSGPCMVCCHMGQSRSMSVAIMYLCLIGGQTWDEMVGILRDRYEDFPDQHPAHREVFNKIDRDLLLRTVRP